MIFKDIYNKNKSHTDCSFYCNSNIFILLCYLTLCIPLYSQQDEYTSRYPQIFADTGLCHEHICFFVNGKMTQAVGYYIIDMGKETRDTVWFSQTGVMIFYYGNQYKKMLSLPPDTKITVCYSIYNYNYYLVSNASDFETGKIVITLENVPLSYVFSYGDNRLYSLCMVTTTVPFPEYYKCSFFKLFEDCILSRYSTDDNTINTKLDHREHDFYFRDSGLRGHLWVE